MIETEKQIIGSILMEPECIGKVYGKLKPDMFVNDFCRDAYQKMLAFYDMGEQISIVTLQNALESKERDKRYISSALMEIVKETDSSAVIGHCADELINEHKSKQVQRLLSSTSYLPNDIEKSIGYLITELEAMRENRDSTCKTMKQIVEEYKGGYFCQKDDNSLRTGFYKLDDKLGGLEGGDVIVLAARPGVGKSAIVTQIIGQMAERGKNVAYFNLEMGESQVYERFLSRLAELELVRVRRAKEFLKDEQRRFDRANDKLMNYNVMVSTGSKTVGEIKNIARNQKFDCIVIDYLQLVRSERKFSNRASEVGEISKSIKALAMELKVPIILLSQLNRTSEHTETKEPEISELRESGDIEQDASIIILLWNISKDSHKAKGLKIGKNRQGELGKIGYEFDGEHMMFRERHETFEQYERHVRDMAKNSPNFEPCDSAPWE